MFNMQNLLGQMIGTGFGGHNRRMEDTSGRGGGLMSMLGGLAGGDGGSGGGLGGMVSRFTGGQREGASGGAGSLGMLGALAMNALGGRGDGGAAEAASSVDDRQASLMIRGMIAAAHADGEIDPEEEQRIVGKLQEAGAGEEEQEFISAQIHNPASIDDLVQQVDGQETASQLYAASLLATSADTPAEQSYLHDLAGRLQLPDETVAELHQQLGIRQVH